jgi:DNA-binding response OmpR family regulator
MIIDDDIDISELFRNFFELEDYRVVTAPDGREGLEILKNTPDRLLPDLIILDYMMPNMNGQEFAFAKGLDSRLEKIPVVLITASGQIASLVHGIQADAYIDKPLDLDALMRVAFNFIHRRHSSQHSFLA